MDTHTTPTRAHTEASALHLVPVGKSLCGCGKPDSQNLPASIPELPEPSVCSLFRMTALQMRDDSPPTPKCLICLRSLVTSSLNHSLGNNFRPSVPWDPSPVTFKFAYFPPKAQDQVCTNSPTVRQTGHLPDSALGVSLDAAWELQSLAGNPVRLQDL